jgi:putative oxidoreductase
MTAAMLAVLATRALLVILFLPFSALDKILNFRGAVGQAREIVPGSLAVILILAGLSVEILMPLAILTGTADRLAGLIMAGYCMVTALLWKQFWQPGDFWQGSDSKGRNLFWDFLKNFSLAGGFLLLVVGSHGGLAAVMAHPLGSSHPYTSTE